MNLVIWANEYDTPYKKEWGSGLREQTDRDFKVILSPLESANTILKYACDNYDAVLMLDIDDIPLPGLIAEAKKQAEQHDVTAFAMEMFGAIHGTFGVNVIPDKYNVYGFGNTVWRTDSLKSLLPVTTDYDTAIRAREAGFDMYFYDVPLIRYRQYGQNKMLRRINWRYVWSTP